MKAKILWIEGHRAEGPYFIPDLRKKDFTVEVVSTGKEANKQLSKDKFDLVVLNAATFRSSGKRICQDINVKWENMPILMIANPDKPVTKDVGADVLLDLPFTIRKLVNRINPLLPHTSNKVMRAGPIQLDLERRVVRCLEKEAHLTPRLTSLLQIFIENPNEVLGREDLFRKIWNTEYTGDTRTLDVHISWIRQAIEPNPRKPRFLITIRGMGYRLDI
ncbi:MAG: response regulator transcription factor [Anaerolineales bacterium]